MTKLLFILIFTFIALIFTGCQSAIDKAVRDTKYSAYEVIGVEKRDLFKKEVKNVKDAQEDTQEDFSDALEKLQAVYKVDGGKLEKAYKSLDSSYKDAEKSVTEVKNNIKKLEVLSGDLFNEWEKEIQEISSRDLRTKSSQSLLNTKNKYNSFHASLKKSEAKMTPVLTRLKDQTLFMKHNLNAKVVAGLKTESDKIQNDINVLIKDMNESIAKADEMIKDLD